MFVVLAALLLGATLLAQGTVVTTGVDGTAQVNATAGTYRFSVNLTDPEMVADPVEVIRGVDAANPLAEQVVITLRPRQYPLSVLVQDDKGRPIPGVEINVTPMPTDNLEETRIPAPGL